MLWFATTKSRLRPGVMICGWRMRPAPGATGCFLFSALTLQLLRQPALLVFRQPFPSRGQSGQIKTGWSAPVRLTECLPDEDQRQPATPPQSACSMITAKEAGRSLRNRLRDQEK